MGISAPVVGSRPVRVARCPCETAPKSISCTASPRLTASVMTSSTAWTVLLSSLLPAPVPAATASTSSYLFIDGFAPKVKVAPYRIRRSTNKPRGQCGAPIPVRPLIVAVTRQLAVSPRRISVGSITHAGAAPSAPARRELAGDSMEQEFSDLPRRFNRDKSYVLSRLHLTTEEWAYARRRRASSYLIRARTSH